jgi:hypothetical protein
MIYQENAADNRARGPLYNAPTTLAKGPVIPSAVTSLPIAAAGWPPARPSGSRFLDRLFMYLVAFRVEDVLAERGSRPVARESSVRKRNPRGQRAASVDKCMTACLVVRDLEIALEGELPLPRAEH